MFMLALEVKTKDLAGPHEHCAAAAEQPEIVGLLFQLCAALHETGAVRFKVVGFDDAPWPVSVRRDLSVVLEQVPDLLQALRSAEREFELNFYEQGIERDLLFTRGPSDRMAVEFYTELDWHPVRSVENIGAAELENLLVTLVKDFVGAVQIVCPDVVDNPLLRDWLLTMSIAVPTAASNR